ncbi:putative alkaline ceramidase dcd3A [Smittium mucronatum]|uniref:Putative alkaline ceramidase dcd3A n=1 Tax=Smittium mucronatum TaxID=133383 RepID=A0A1R0GMK3_9FUNG|nr:putative alkaline ceramidase dcd3A [Smittium mucronatum]
MYRSISVIGLGSALFHGTLKQPMQMFDEIPMIWLAIIVLYVLLNVRYGLDKLWIKLGLASVGIFGSYVTASSQGIVQFYLFQLFFICLQICMFALMYLANRDICLTYHSKTNELAKHLLSNGIKWYGVAVSCWLADTFFCKYINGGPASYLPIYLQLHALWHIFISFSLTHFVLLVVVYYRISKGQTVYLKSKFLGLPEISMAKYSH